MVTKEPPAATKPPEAHASSATDARPVLDPVERLSEIVFGLIMAMTFTGSIHAAQAGREEIRTMLFGALGCNVAWGVVDAVMYVLTTSVTRDHWYGVQRKLASAAGSPDARRILTEELPEALGSAMSPAEADAVIRWVARQPPPERRRLGPGDLRAAIGVFLLVSLSTLPVALPFVFLRDPVVALRSSHGIAVAMLFVSGASLGRYSGRHPLRTGTAMALIGLVLVLVTISLGG